jgi:hypothetical protein
VLGAVNASALRADRERECARLRALTAPPRSAVSWQLRDGRGVVEFDAAFVTGVSCGYLVGVDHDTPLRIAHCGARCGGISGSRSQRTFSQTNTPLRCST